MPRSTRTRRDFLFTAALASLAPVFVGRSFAAAKSCAAIGAPASGLDVRYCGAVGDGRRPDTAAINAAIEAVAKHGGGIVRLPAGDYLTSTLYLKDGVTIFLEDGAILRAAPPGDYGIAEPNRWARYQDYGHDHWANSLISGIGVKDVAIVGAGVICGDGLSRGGWSRPFSWTRGTADKVIALKECRNVSLSGFSVLGTAHMGILATGVEKLTISNLLVDTLRDGIDIDCCEDVAIEDCAFNTPHDDSIALKSSAALGYKRVTRNVAIRRCFVTGGFKPGSYHDGSKQPIDAADGMKSRIKIGTESCWGFSDIRIENCVIRDSLGIALLTVDGGGLDNVAIRGITMQNIQDAPFFLRLGERLRAPTPGAQVASFRQVAIDDVKCYRFGMPIMISGIPGHRIEDVALRNIELVERAATAPRAGGGWMPVDRAWTPARSFAPPEDSRGYPEVGMFGPVPAKALFARHVERLTLDRLRLCRVTAQADLAASDAQDRRPFFWLQDVEDSRFAGIAIPGGASNPICWSDRSDGFSVSVSEDLTRAPDWQAELPPRRLQKASTGDSLGTVSKVAAR
jgi:Pectate lyase superfamily protein